MTLAKADSPALPRVPSNVTWSAVQTTTVELLLLPKIPAVKQDNKVRCPWLWRENSRTGSMFLLRTDERVRLVGELLIFQSHMYAVMSTRPSTYVNVHLNVIPTTDDDPALQSANNAIRVSCVTVAYIVD